MNYGTSTVINTFHILTYFILKRKSFYIYQNTGRYNELLNVTALLYSAY